MQHAATVRAHAPSPASTLKGEPECGCLVLSAAQRGQTLLEFAVTTTIVVVLLFSVLQLSLIVVQQYGASQVARQTARWLAVRIDTIDADAVAQARTYATDLPGLGATGMTGVTISPSCTTLSGGKCSGRSSGDAVTVTVTTSLAPVMFLPTTYGWAPYQLRFPASLPAISYTVLLE
jgi:hypothetical protein